MRREHAIDRAARMPGVALACALFLGLTGCATLQGTPPPRGNAVLPPASELQASSAIAATLELLQRLLQGGPAEQAEALAAARTAYEESPRGGAELRYALALAAPRHPARDPALAQRLLRELLAAPETLLPLERSLALIELQRVDTELRLTAENRRLVAEAERERNRDRGGGAAVNVALNKRLQAEIDENARLRKALDEARAKLDAVATIEQNITERKPTTEGRRP
jgi:hypothetical protein